MRPDDRQPHGPGPEDMADVVSIDLALALDPDLEALAVELGAAGSRVRAARATGGAERPNPAFAVDLRTRLLARLPASAATAAAQAAATPVAAGWAARQAERRLVPAAELWADAPARPVEGRIAPRTPTVLPAPRWTVLAIAAVFVVSILGLQAQLLMPGVPESRASDVVGATLTRDAVATPLTAGTELRAGDLVAVTGGGRATLGPKPAPKEPNYKALLWAHVGKNLDVFNELAQNSFGYDAKDMSAEDMKQLWEAIQ